MSLRAVPDDLTTALDRIAVVDAFAALADPNRAAPPRENGGRPNDGGRLG
jgi:hypothetical protein